MRQDDDDDAASPRVARASSQSHAPISQGRARSLCCMPTLHTRPRSTTQFEIGSCAWRKFFPPSAPALWQRMVGGQEEKYERKYQTARRWLGQMRRRAHPHGASIEQERGDAPHQSAQPSQAQSGQPVQPVQPGPERSQYRLDLHRRACPAPGLQPMEQAQAWLNESHRQRLTELLLVLLLQGLTERACVRIPVRHPSPRPGCGARGCRSHGSAWNCCVGRSGKNASQTAAD